MAYKSVSGGNPDDSFNKLPARLRARAPAALLAGGLILEGTWKAILLTPGTGRVYGKHQASAPGEPPAPDRGDLQRSITHEFDGEKMRVGTNDVKAEPLEFGTTTAGRSHNVVILPRPHGRPAGAASKGPMTDAVVATFKRGNARAD